MTTRTGDLTSFVEQAATIAAQHGIGGEGTWLEDPKWGPSLVFKGRENGSDLQLQVHPDVDDPTEPGIRRRIYSKGNQLYRPGGLPAAIREDADGILAVQWDDFTASLRAGRGLSAALEWRSTEDEFDDRVLSRFKFDAARPGRLPMEGKLSSDDRGLFYEVQWGERDLAGERVKPCDLEAWSQENGVWVEAMPDRWSLTNERVYAAYERTRSWGNISDRSPAQRAGMHMIQARAAGKLPMPSLMPTTEPPVIGI